MSDRLVRIASALSLGAIVLGAVLAGALGDLGLGILVLAGGALLFAIATLWTSLAALSGDVPMTIDDAIALSSPGDADVRKRAILVALKDLDFDFAVGKIAPEDYEVLVNRYRQQAKLLLRGADEQISAVRLRAAAYVAEHGRPLRTEPSVCQACRAKNAADAVFCSKCGVRLPNGVEEKTVAAP
jgi:hypothetical protein